MSTLAMLFAGGTDSAVPELTDARSMASVPFGCRYRLIDFTLSNLVNAGISHVAILTQHNYQSLMDHLGSGKEWDLARRNGGLDILRNVHDLAHDAVDTHAHHKLALPRLHVDIAGALGDGALQHGVDQPDGGRAAHVVLADQVGGEMQRKGQQNQPDQR